MRALFIELPAFEKYRQDYLTDEHYHAFQQQLLENPLCGDLLQHTGGLRKVRFQDTRRGKGKRGGLRIIYYWWWEDATFFLFTLYDKDELSDLTKQQRDLLSPMLRQIKRGNKQ